MNTSNDTSSSLLAPDAGLLPAAASFLIAEIPSSARRQTRAVVDQIYLVRYGVMGHVGRFSGQVGAGVPFRRGQFVVIEHRAGSRAR